MKYGIKLWSTNTEYFNRANEYFKKGHFDFIELYIVPNSYNEESLTQLKEIPVNLHLPNEDLFNLLSDDPSLNTTISEAEKFIAFFKPKYIISHLGMGENNQNLEKNLNKIKHFPLFIENVPTKAIDRMGGLPLYGFTKEQLQTCRPFCKGYCLDFTHANKAAVALQKDPIEFIQGLSEIGPKVFHISDGRFTPIDEHLSLGEGEFDLSFNKSTIPNDGFVVMETPFKDDLLDDALENLKRFKEL